MYRSGKPKSQQQWFSSTFGETQNNSSNSLRHCRSDNVCGRKTLPNKRCSKPLASPTIEMVSLLSDSDDDIIVLSQSNFIESKNLGQKRGSKSNSGDFMTTNKAKKRRISSRDKSQQKNSVSFIQQFHPTSIEQLAVHSKKVEEIRQWLVDHQSTQKRHKLLLLLGPCGTGKTATIRVLCSALKLELTEWESPDQFTVSDVDGETCIQEMSQALTFEEFLKKANMGTLEKRHVQRLLLIEQIPNIFYREPNRLYDLLHRYTVLSSCIFIFIMSVVDSSWYLNPKRIFTSSVISELHMDVISFNSTALTLLQKALRQVLDALNVKASYSQIKRIAESGSGDIRATLNNLQICLNEDGKLLDIALSSSSSQLDTFHSIGKLLYAKRVENSNFDWNAQEDRLSSLLLSNNYKRSFPLKDDVNEVIIRSGLSGEKLASFIHEHEIRFCGTVENISKVFDNISLMDSTFEQWNVRINSAIPDYEAQVSARAVTYYNYGYKPCMRRMYNFHKAKWDSVKLSCDTLHKEASAAYPGIAPGTLFSFVLPVLSVLDGRQLDLPQWQLFTKIYANSLFGPHCISYGRHHSVVKNIVNADIDNEEFDIEEIDD